MRITLITGGNKGLGFEAARRLLAEGHKVYIGARDAERGQKAAKDLGAQFVQIDVTNSASVNAAASEIEKHEGHLDVLINNAGISGGMVTPVDLTVETMEETYATNVFGIVRVTKAFLPLLKKSSAPVIVNVSSGLGSFATVHDTKTIESTVLAAHYNSSKSAVNMLTVQYAKALPAFRINCVDPGYTATDLNHNSGPQTVTEGTDAMVKMALVPKDGPTGSYVSRHGVMPW
nr:short chain dehydrogenase [uncultured organism]